MTYQGVDTVHRFTAEDAKKAENGVSFVGRYLVPSGMGKDLTKEEADNLRGAGLAVLLCWEIGAYAVQKGAAQGTKDGARARALAESFGIPAGTTIYFACDYNIPTTDLIMAEQYILAAQTALGKYEAGAYGPLRLVEFLHDRGSCKKFWQCVAWSAYFSGDAQTWQYQWSGSPDALDMAAKLGFSVDLDTCDDLQKAGMWMPWDEYADGDGTIIETGKPAQGNTSSGADAPPSPQGEGTGMWYDKAMAWGEATGIMKDGRPNDTATRAEIITMLMRYHQMLMETIRNQQPEDDKKFSGLLDG